MALKVTKVQVWAGRIEDRPGGLAAVLGPLAEASVNLECMIGRRLHAGLPGEAGAPAPSGAGVVFVTPIKGKKAQAAASAAGLDPTQTIPTLRIDGSNKAGMSARMTAALGDAGISMRGITGACIGNKFVVYIGFDSAEDADKAAKVLKKL